MAPQIPDGQCPHCHAPIVDLFAEWTEEYETPSGKQAILAGEIAFDCYYCGEPLQLVLPIALVAPRKSSYHIAKRRRSKCEEWLRSQHPGHALSEIVEMAGWEHQGAWAFDGYNWQEGDVHHHGQDSTPPTAGGAP